MRKKKNPQKKAINLCFLFFLMLNSGIAQNNVSKVQCIDSFCIGSNFDASTILRFQKITKSTLQDEYEEWNLYTLSTINGNWIKIEVFDSITNEIVSVSTNDKTKKIFNGIKCGFTLKRTFRKLKCCKYNIIYENQKMYLFSCELGMLFLFDELEKINELITEEELNMIINNPNTIFDLKRNLGKCKLIEIKCITVEC